jgi:hypothetical protein
MRVDYEDRPFDSQRYTQSVGMRQQLSSGAGVTLRASMQQVDPKDAPNYRIEEALLAYDGSGARTTLSLEAGATRLRGSGRGSETGAVMRAELSRKLGDRSTLTLGAGREYSDAGNNLGGWNAEGLPPDAADVLALSGTTDPYQATSARLGWLIEGRVTSLELFGAWHRERGTGATALDRTERRLVLRGRRQLGAKLRAGADFWYVDQDIRGSGESNESTAQVNVGWRLGRRVSIETAAEFARFEYDLVPRAAHENRFWLRLRYGNDPE